MDRHLFIGVFAVAVGLASLAGCGGGGTTTEAGLVSVHVVDGFREDYAQVWSSVYRVELKTAGGQYCTVFESADGEAVNAADLAGTSQFMGVGAAPQGAYTRARVTLHDHIRLVDRAGRSHDLPLAGDAGAGMQAGGQGRFTCEFDAPLQVSSGKRCDLVVDFDLANFQVQGGQVRARLQGADASRVRGYAHTGAVRGTVSSLTTSGFSLLQASGRSVAVTMDAVTTVVSQSTGDTVALAEGQRVAVTGAYDWDARTVAADLIVVNDLAIVPAGSTVAHVRGAVTAADPVAGSFVLTPRQAQCVLPNAATMTVTISDITNIVKAPREPGVPADITVGADVNVVGTLNSDTGTLAATAVVIRR